MGIDNIRHPIKDTVKADNSTYSSNKIESLIHSATELPETSIEDAGDVLMVNEEGEWDKGEIIIPQELPTVTSEDAGDVLMVNDDGEWTNGEIPNEIPSFESGDALKTIEINNSGTALAWRSPYVFFLACATITGTSISQCPNFVSSRLTDSTSEFGFMVADISLAGEILYFHKVSAPNSNTLRFMNFRHTTSALEIRTIDVSTSATTLTGVSINKSVITYDT